MRKSGGGTSPSAALADDANAGDILWGLPPSQIGLWSGVWASAIFPIFCRRNLRRGDISRDRAVKLEDKMEKNPHRWVTEAAKDYVVTPPGECG